MHARVVLGVGKGVLLREVSSFQECPHRERERERERETTFCSIYTTRKLYSMHSHTTHEFLRKVSVSEIMFIFQQTLHEALHPSFSFLL